MKDKYGLYYYAYAGNPSVRVYVRNGENGEIEFKMWDNDHPEVWENHPWLSISVIRKAATLYKNERKNGIDPLKLYDLNIAKTLLRENND